MDNYALQLTGGGYATAPSNQVYNRGMGDFTVEAWIKPTGAGTIISRIQTVAGNQQIGFGLGLLPDGRIQMTVSDGTSEMDFDTDPTPVLDSKWHHVAGVRRGLSLHVYVDSIPLPRWPSFRPIAWINVNNSAPLTLGGGSTPYQGQINEVRFWNYARSRDQITYALGLPLRGEQPGLIGYWSFTDGTFTDSSPTRNNAAGQGTFSFVTPGALSCGVEFILDGRDYFTRFKELLLTVRKAQDPNVPDFKIEPTFQNLIVEVGKYAPIRLIMWNKEKLTSLAGAAWEKVTRRFGGGFLTADATGQIAAAAAVVQMISPPDPLPEPFDPRVNSKTKRAVILQARPAGSDVEIFLEDYFVRDMPLLSLVFSAQHQKLAVFSIKGKKYALIGGINLEGRYWDDAQPRPHPMYDLQNYHTWHDTAVLFGEPAASAVEWEIDWRWAKNLDPTKPITGDTYVKMAFWSIEHETSFNLDWKQGEVSDPGHPTAIVDQATPVPLEVLITNHERTAIAEVEDCLLARIAAAEQYIYLENFCFHSFKLVQAVAQRLKEKPDLTVIIMVPHSFKGQDGLEKSESFLTRLAFIALSIPFATTVKFVDGTQVTKGTGDQWHVAFGQPPLGELEFAMFLYQSSGGPQQSRPLTEIADVTLPENAPFIPCAPVRRLPPEDCHNNETYGLTGDVSPYFRRIYVHSKMALFDDTYAVVGSANFNRRSMQDDGELSVMIHDPAQVAQIRESLFQHYGMNTAADWRSRMQTFVGSTQPGIGVIPMSIPSMYPDWGDYGWWILSLLADVARLG